MLAQFRDFLSLQNEMIQRYLGSVAVSVRRRENMNSRRAVCAVLPFSKFPCMYVLTSTVLQWDTLIPLLSINKTSTVKSSSNPFCAKNVWSSKKWTSPQTLIPMFVSIWLMSYKVVNFYREFNISVRALEIPFRRFLNGQEVVLQFKQCASISISLADTFQTFYLKVSSISWCKCRQIEAFRGKIFWRNVMWTSLFSSWNL